MCLLTVIILTFNEEMHLGRCIKSAKQLTDSILIIDSFSDDRTIEIANEYNCQIKKHAFINQADQLNWAINNVEVEGDWILRLDADEYLSDELIVEVQNTLQGLDQNVSGIYLRRRVYFMNKWMRFGGYYPVWLLRMWRQGKAICELRHMDEHMKVLEGYCVSCKNDFIDHNLQNLTWWINKHNSYASREAISFLIEKYHLQDTNNTVKPSLWGKQEQQKRWVKENIYNNSPLFFRPILYFNYRYFIKLGFLDGKAGLIWHVLQGFWYRFLVDAKIYQVLQNAGWNREKVVAILNESGKTN